jgi:hypothetical protein
MTVGNQNTYTLGKLAQHSYGNNMFQISHERLFLLHRLQKPFQWLPLLEATGTSTSVKNTRFRGCSCFQSEIETTLAYPKWAANPNN